MNAWLSTWFKAARAPFLVVSFLPALLGGIVAVSNGPIHMGVFIAAVIGIVMAHSAADFIDDYFDYKKGNLGNKVQQFHDSPLIDQRVTLNQVLIATAICLVIAGAAGIYVLMQAGAVVLLLVAVGAFIVFFYTSPPLMLNYRGLGETMLFLAFGPMIVVGVDMVLTGRFGWEALLLSIVPGVFTMNVGVVSNTFDYLDDIKSGKRTISVRFGQPATVRLIAIGSVIAYLCVILGVVFKLLPVWTLLVLLTIPLAVDTVRNVNRFNDESCYTPAMTRAIALSSVASILLIAAYGIMLVFQQ
jgi:1,4-dihydroxy-2-naphthoate polyprenyltransferase